MNSNNNSNNDSDNSNSNTVENDHIITTICASTIDKPYFGRYK